MKATKKERRWNNTMLQTNERIKMNRNQMMFLKLRFFIGAVADCVIGVKG